MNDMPILTKSGPKKLQQLRLNNLANVKKSLARIVNATLQDDANLNGLRAAIYALNCLIAAYRIDNEFELNELRRRVEAIERDGRP